MADNEQLKQEITYGYCGSSVKAIIAALFGINRRCMTFKVN